MSSIFVHIRKKNYGDILCLATWDRNHLIICDGVCFILDAKWCGNINDFEYMEDIFQLLGKDDFMDLDK